MSIVLVLAALLGWFVWIYNRFVQLDQRMTEAWSGVDVQLKRRHDLIPNLVEAVRAYRDYERSVMESVTTLRSKAMETTGIREKGTVESALSREVRQLMAVVEKYPDLKASNHFLALHRSLVTVEDEIQMARRYF